MRFMIYRQNEGGPRLYRAPHGWDCDPNKAIGYSLRGAQSMIGKFERQWVIDPERPKRWGFTHIEEAIV